MKHLNNNYKNPTISVIVPVYNVESFITICLDSIINQSYKNLEIIVINDGSTDNSGKIVESYRGKDNRIKIFHQSNAGLSETRNRGIKLSHGEYISFVDSDDWLDLNCYSKLVDFLKDKEIDVLCYDIIEVENGYEKKYQHIPVFEDKKFALDELNVLSKTWPLVWAKLYKADFIKNNDINFPSGLLYEDNAFIYECWSHNPVIFCVNENLHYYRMSRPGSITYKKNKRTIEIFDVMEIIKKQFINAGIMNKFPYVIDWSIDNLLWLYQKTPEDYKNAFEKKLIKQFFYYLSILLVNNPIKNRQKIFKIIKILITKDFNL